jgi:hypothetical protein
MEQLFQIANLVVMPFWLLMLLAPGWSWTARILRSPLVALAPALAYAALALPDLARLLPAVMSPKLDAVAALLGTPRGATLGWLHFLAFDLLVGRWVYLEARERRIPAWLSSPVLFFVLMLGPVGFLLHLGLRARFPVSLLPERHDGAES